MKIYVLTRGTHSAYHIVGVFTSREKALEFCPALESELSDEEKPGLEEWDSDPPRPQEFIQATWRVYIWISDGSLYTESVAAEEHPIDYSKSTVNTTSNHPTADGISVVSRDHAFKLAVEARLQYLREKALTPQ